MALRGVSEQHGDYDAIALYCYNGCDRLGGGRTKRQDHIAGADPWVNQSGGSAGALGGWLVHDIVVQVSRKPSTSAADALRPDRTHATEVAGIVTPKTCDTA